RMYDLKKSAAPRNCSACHCERFVRSNPQDNRGDCFVAKTAPRNDNLSSHRAAENFGFKFRGGKGSHRIYVRPGVRDLLNFQNAKGKAKPYQVKEFLKVIEQYHLLEE
ncbi:MAG: type II toxin-antitoxin system HicA family toxin, partial [Chloroflexota bacterium]|nr:type II toxin-antitoxin system HicA family toxin [Chloroflexota bacterium]